MNGLFGMFSRKGNGSADRSAEQPPADDTPTGQIPVLSGEPDAEAAGFTDGSNAGRRPV